MKNLLTLAAIALLTLTASAADWNTRATADLNQNFIPTNSAAIAKIIISTIHPSGKNPTLEKFQVLPSGNNLSVSFEVDWKSVYNHDYKTIVVWQFNQTGHVSTTVLAENSVFKASKEAEKKLDEYFKLEVYPNLCSSLK